MQKIIIATHGALAYELINTIKLFTNGDNLVPLCIVSGDNLSEFKEKMYKEIITNPFEEVLILTDLLGGTPFNTAAQIILEYGGTKKIDIITGVNVPMLLEILVGNKDLPMTDSVNSVIDAGRNGIKNFQAEFSKKKEGDGSIEHCAQQD